MHPINTYLSACQREPVLGKQPVSDNQRKALNSAKRTGYSAVLFDVVASV
jgi:hypothetical protein